MKSDLSTCSSHSLPSTAEEATLQSLEQPEPRVPSTAAHSQQQPPQPLHGCAYSDAGDICERPPAGQAPCRPVGAICAAVRPERRCAEDTDRQTAPQQAQADPWDNTPWEPDPGAHTSPTYAATSIAAAAAAAGACTPPHRDSTTGAIHYSLPPSTNQWGYAFTYYPPRPHTAAAAPIETTGQPRPQQLAGAPAPAGDTTQAAVAHRPTQGTVLAASNTPGTTGAGTEDGLPTAGPTQGQPSPTPATADMQAAASTNTEATPTPPTSKPERQQQQHTQQGGSVQNAPTQPTRNRWGRSLQQDCGGNASKRQCKTAYAQRGWVKRDDQTWKEEEVAHYVGLREEDDEEEWAKVLAHGAQATRGTRLGPAATQPTAGGTDTTDWSDLLNRHHLPRGSIPPRPHTTTITQPARQQQDKPAQREQRPQTHHRNRAGGDKPDPTPQPHKTTTRGGGKEYSIPGSDYH